MDAKLDVVVIGAGPGGIAAAYALRASGQNVAIVEENLWGGTCPNRGCDPKKILYSAVELQEHANFMAGAGVHSEIDVDWSQLMTHKRGYTEKVPTGTQGGLDGAGITTLYGHAMFNEQGQLTVDGQLVEADNYIIATGERPAILPVEGQEYLKTSTDFLNLDQLPDSVTFIGGGYVAFELASIARAAGAEVHVIHHNDRPLKEFDPELVDSLMEQMKATGIHFHLNTDIKTVAQDGSQMLLSDHDEFELHTDMVFSTVGRIPNADTLGLDKVNVTILKDGIRVNHYLRTDNPHIYAIGDVVTRVGKEPKLTPVSSFEGRYVADLIAGKTTKPINYPIIPTVVYATPKLAKIGLNMQQVSESYCILKDLDVTSWYTYYRQNETLARVKVILDKQDTVIVGAQVLSASADELINYLTYAVNQRQTLDEVQKNILAYPSVASDLPYMF